jgi:DNA-binding MarR family transcriptional regulator
MRSKGFTKKDYVLLADFRRTLRKFLRFSEENARATGITPQQYQLLVAVKGQPKRDWATISELADALQLKHQTVVELIDRSVAADLVTRRQGVKDRRQVQVQITERGEDLLMQTARHNRQELQTLLNAINRYSFDSAIYDLKED